MTSWILLFGSSACSAASGILMKIAASRSEGGATLLSLGSMGLYGVAVISYGLGFILYALALRKLPLHTAYPAMVGVAVLLIFLYQRVSGQSLTVSGIIGPALILGGIWLVLRGG